MGTLIAIGLFEDVNTRAEDFKLFGRLYSEGWVHSYDAVSGNVMYISKEPFNGSPSLFEDSTSQTTLEIALRALGWTIITLDEYERTKEEPVV
ncbi:hypothetical protein [Bacillus subtilis]|uniref:hypothetical protein n=1 Tax=Bacillus subtilis TaxID=1423 RepID=UPI0025CB1F91|nr:hypothetical protein [Bacillus subtilis]WCS67969.1 hypothetical protein Goe26_00570 [Bacillus phage vB_BsuM-Goe26]GLI90556.1 hypothetical protein ANABIO4_39080 [Bacillus subtilis]